MELHEFTIVFTDSDFVGEIKYIIRQIHDFLEKQEFIVSLSVGSSDDDSITVYIAADKNIPVQDIRRKVIESFPATSRPADILRLV